jgi:hypothetical protein
LEGRSPCSMTGGLIMITFLLISEAQETCPEWRFRCG